MTTKSSTADDVRTSVIRRPTGAAAAARAASTFQNAEEASPANNSVMSTATAHEAIRTTLHLAPMLRIGLKRSALNSETTMTELIRGAISTGLQEPGELAEASMSHRRVSSGARTTLDLPRDMHRTLKRLAADEETSVQALVTAAILRAYPNLV